MMDYELSPDLYKLSSVFSKMQHAVNILPIEDYSVSQNTLDNVRIQRPGGHRPPPRGAQTPPPWGGHRPSLNG